jgi:hypothetical protein
VVFFRNSHNIFLAWRRGGKWEDRIKRPKPSQKYRLCKTQSSVDKEIFHADWTLKSGWSCEKIGSIFDSMLMFSNGNRKHSGEHDLRKIRQAESEAFERKALLSAPRVWKT